MQSTELLSTPDMFNTDYSSAIPTTHPIPAEFQQKRSACAKAKSPAVLTGNFLPPTPVQTTLITQLQHQSALTRCEQEGGACASGNGHVVQQRQRVVLQRRPGRYGGTGSCQKLHRRLLRRPWRCQHVDAWRGGSKGRQGSEQLARLPPMPYTPCPTNPVATCLIPNWDAGRTIPPAMQRPPY